jgi:SAM-dependent methyltransferase
MFKSRRLAVSLDIDTQTDSDVQVQGYFGPAASAQADDRGEGELLLDIAHGAILDGHAPAMPLNLLNSGLKMIRSYARDDAWADFCRRAQQHPLIELLREDPFFARVQGKPRGYAGDAVMIDLIYRTGDCAAQVAASSPLGRALYAVNSASAAADGVRERRSIIAYHIDNIAAARTLPTIVAVAAGHLREAALSRAFADGRIGRWIALDQDPDSIAEIGASLGDRIETVADSISVILKGDFTVTDADFVYAAGLYDYLPHAIATRLTRKLAAMLRPGGRLLFANFAADIWDAGFMEALMDWKLILRTPADMRRIAEGAGEGFAIRQWTGTHGAIHYCELIRT